MKDKLLYLEWDDSASNINGVWKHLSALNNQSAQCRSVGFLLFEDHRCVTIACSVSDTDDVTGNMTIPKSAITKRRLLSHK